MFKSQLVKDGEVFLLKKGTPKASQGFGPYQNKPFCGPHHNKKRGSYSNSSQSSNQSFSSGEGNRTREASEVVFDPIQGDEGLETPSNDSLKPSLSPPVRGRLPSFRKDWLRNNLLNIITNGYVLQFISKPNLVRAPLIRSGYKASGLLYPVSSVKERNRKGGICKISWVLQSPVSSPQASPKVEASNRPKQAQHLPTCRKVHQGNSDSRGMGVIDRLIRRLPSHPHPPKLKEVPKGLPQVTGVPVHLPSLRASHGPTVLYNDCKRSESAGPVKWSQTSLAPGRLAYQDTVS